MAPITAIRSLLLGPLLGALALVASVVHAAEPVSFVSEAEFRQLASQLAQKVNLFSAVWRLDPDAEFYGGTSRDFLYWIKGKLNEAGTPAEAQKIVSDLKALPMIDVREFIIGESDVDIISPKKIEVDAEQFGIKKIDSRGNELFDLETMIGRSEIEQGFIPAEKIRLGRSGLVPPSSFGNGVREILEGKLSVHFSPPEVFAKTHYAKQKLNHPILLALRYLRLQAMDYFRSHGKGYPDRARLIGAIPEGIQQQLRETIRSATNGLALNEYLEQQQFSRWLNGTIQKAFRSYTNPTAAKRLMDEFGVSDLSSYYPKHVEPINQYLFQKYREPAEVRKALQDFQVDETLFFQSTQKEFPDGKLYHGTKTEDGFRNILFQGILPSTAGNAGDGLYGVNVENRGFAEEFGGAAERLVSLEVEPGARVVDISQGEGKRVFDRFKAGHSVAPETPFADHFGVDILIYPHRPRAYVVKNAAVLGRPQGVYRQLMSVGRMVEQARAASSKEEITRLFRTMELNRFRADEMRVVLTSAMEGSPGAVIRKAELIAAEVLSLAHEADRPLLEAWAALPEASKFPRTTEAVKNTLSALSMIDKVKTTFERPRIADFLASMGPQDLESRKRAFAALSGALVREGAIARNYYVQNHLWPEWLELLAQEPWSGLPGVDSWIDQALAADSGVVAKHFLGSPTAISNPKWEGWMDVVMKDKVHRGSVHVTTRVLPNPLAAQKAVWKALMEESLDRFVQPSYMPEAEGLARVLAQPFTWDMPEWESWATRLVDRDYSSNLSYAEEILKAPRSADHPQFIEMIIRSASEVNPSTNWRKDAGVLAKLEALLRAQPHWRDHPKLNALCAGQPLSVFCLEQGFKRGVTFLDAPSGCLTKAVNGLIDPR